MWPPQEGFRIKKWPPTLPEFSKDLHAWVHENIRDSPWWGLVPHIITTFLLGVPTLLCYSWVSLNLVRWSSRNDCFRRFGSPLQAPLSQSGPVQEMASIPFLLSYWLVLGVPAYPAESLHFLLSLTHADGGTRCEQKSLDRKAVQQEYTWWGVLFYPSFLMLQCGCDGNLDGSSHELRMQGQKNRSLGLLWLAATVPPWDSLSLSSSIWESKKT